MSVPQSAKDDIARLSKLLYEYETVNQQQKLDIESLNKKTEATGERFMAIQRENQGLSKKIKSLNDTLKFERISLEGIRKKFNLNDVEVRDLRKDKQNFILEITLVRQRAADLEVSVNSDRSKRLQLMHENEVLRMNAAEWEVQEKAAREDQRKAQASLMDKLMQFDRLFGVNEVQKKTIDSQSNEMIALSKEVNILQERNMYLNQLLSDRGNEIAENRKVNDILQQEIFRLRKELINMSTNITERSSALANSGTSKLTNKITSYSCTQSAGNSLSTWPAGSGMIRSPLSTSKGRSTSPNPASSSHKLVPIKHTVSSALSVSPSSSSAPTNAQSSMELFSTMTDDARAQLPYFNQQQNNNHHEDHDLDRTGASVSFDMTAASSSSSSSFASSTSSFGETGPADSSQFVSTDRDWLSNIHMGIGKGDTVSGQVVDTFLSSSFPVSRTNTVHLTSNTDQSHITKTATLHRPYEQNDLKSVEKMKENADETERIRYLKDLFRNHQASSSGTTADTSSSTSSTFSSFQQDSLVNMQKAYKQSPLTTPSKHKNGKSHSRGLHSAASASTNSISTKAPMAAKKDLVHGKKTAYVGAGLGMKQNEKLDSELMKLTHSGSTKHMIRQILGDEEGQP